MSLVSIFVFVALSQVSLVTHLSRRRGKAPNTEVTLVVGPARQKQLFDYIVKHTNEYAPLDYCGIGHIFLGQYVTRYVTLMFSIDLDAAQRRSTVQHLASSNPNSTRSGPRLIFLREERR